MKTKNFSKILLIAIVLLFAILSVNNNAFSQSSYCIIKRELNIPYEYEFFKTNILANAPFEIIITVVEATEEDELEIKLITGGTHGEIAVNGKTLTYYLGNDVYGSGKTDYEILGPESDIDTNIPVPAFTALFIGAAMKNPSTWSGYDWDQYSWDANARIKKILISSNAVKIKYIEFLDIFGDPHPSSQHFGDYNNFSETGWENLTLTTGNPIIYTSDETLILQPIQNMTGTSSFYPDSFFPYYGYGYTPFYGYPTYSPYSYGGSYGYNQWSYPGSYTAYYPGSYSWSYPTSYSNYNSFLNTPLFPSGWSFRSLLNTQMRGIMNYSFNNPLYSLGMRPFGSFGTNSYLGGFYGVQSFAPFGYTGIY